MSASHDLFSKCFQVFVYTSTHPRDVPDSEMCVHGVLNSKANTNRRFECAIIPRLLQRSIAIAFLSTSNRKRSIARHRKKWFCSRSVFVLPVQPSPFPWLIAVFCSISKKRKYDEKYNKMYMCIYRNRMWMWIVGSKKTIFIRYSTTMSTVAGVLRSSQLSTRFHRTAFAL